jgi:hypothetical protein
VLPTAHRLPVGALAPSSSSSDRSQVCSSEPPLDPPAGCRPSSLPFSGCAADSTEAGPSRVGFFALQPLENCIASTSIFVLPSYKEPTVDALASSTDEGRVWLRKATGSCRESVDPWMSEWGNPAPVMGCDPRLNQIGREEGTRGIETSQYPEEKKTTVTP